MLMQPLKANVKVTARPSKRPRPFKRQKSEKEKFSTKRVNKKEKC